MARSGGDNPTTPRRSRRHEPVATAPEEDIKATYTWVGDPLRQRPTDEADEEDLDLDDDESNEPRYTTVFYKEVSRYSEKYRGTRNFTVGEVVRVSPDWRPSFGVITSLFEIEDARTDKRRFKAKLHWFHHPAQLGSVKSHGDAEPGEIFYSLSSTGVIEMNSIIKQCEVGTKHIGKWKSDQFMCKRAIDAVHGLHYKFNWTAHREKCLKADNDAWNLKGAQKIESQPAAEQSLSKRDREQQPDQPNESESEGDSGSEDNFQERESGAEDEEDPIETDSSDAESVEGSQDEDADNDATSVLSDSAPQTPRKRRRKETSTTTPRKRRKNAPALTPHSKAALRKRRNKVVVRPPNANGSNTFSIDVKNLPSDPFLRAMHVLHVGARPDELPCREDEFGQILGAIMGLLEDGTGGCVYISGVPGTGKTATVHAAVRELKRMAESDEINPFSYVEINGLKVPEPSASYALLWEAVSGHDVTVDGHMKISSKEALRRLTRHFEGKQTGPDGPACVVLMDELDQLLTSKQDVVYNFFNWPNLRNSKLIVIAVANTMDLPERVMTGRVRSRLGMVRINFSPYTRDQLMQIVHARLKHAQEGLGSESSKEIIKPDGVKFAASKVSSVSGDARRVLDICRRAVELGKTAGRAANMTDVSSVISAMQNSPTAIYLRECSLHERVMLASILKCARRTGVEEVRWADVHYQHLQYLNILTDADSEFPKPGICELGLVADSLFSSRAIIMEDKTVAVARKGEGERKMMLNIEPGEVERVLSDVGGLRWRNALVG